MKAIKGPSCQKLYQEIGIKDLKKEINETIKLFFLTKQATLMYN